MTQRDQGHQKKQKINGRLRRKTEKGKLGKKNRKEKEDFATCANDAEGLGALKETKNQWQKHKKKNRKRKTCEEKQKRKRRFCNLCK